MHRYASVIVVLGALACAGCEACWSGSANPGGAAAQEVANRTQAVVEEARQKREARTMELAKMDVAALIRELTIDSQKGREPFNSLPYAELVSRGAPAAPAVRVLVKQTDRSSLLTLLALRQISPTEYQQLDPTLRVTILVDALRTSPFFNTWGQPHLRWEEAARALIAEGTAAEAPLKALLIDKREVRVWGGEDASEARRYRYRVSDYAWALLNEIGGHVVPIPVDPAERDKLQLGGKP
jgi:hypothetical protein